VTATDDIRRLLEAKAQALVAREAGDLGRLIHGDFVYVNAGGRTFDKTAYLETYCTSGKVVFAQQRFTDLDVRLIDGVAVATVLIDDEFRTGERRVSGRYRSLCVFIRAPGGWLWAAGQTMTAGVT
jgi:hypothetical protein